MLPRNAEQEPRMPRVLLAAATSAHAEDALRKLRPVRRLIAARRDEVQRAPVALRVGFGGFLALGGRCEALRGDGAVAARGGAGGGRGRLGEPLWLDLGEALAGGTGAEVLGEHVGAGWADAGADELAAAEGEVRVLVLLGVVVVGGALFVELGEDGVGFVDEGLGEGDEVVGDDDGGRGAEEGQDGGLEIGGLVLGGMGGVGAVEAGLVFLDSQEVSVWDIVRWDLSEAKGVRLLLQAFRSS